MENEIIKHPTETQAVRKPENNRLNPDNENVIKNTIETTATGNTVMILAKDTLEYYNNSDKISSAMEKTNAVSVKTPVVLGSSDVNESAVSCSKPVPMADEISKIPPNVASSSSNSIRNEHNEDIICDNDKNDGKSAMTGSENIHQYEDVECSNEASQSVDLVPAGGISNTENDKDMITNVSVSCNRGNIEIETFSETADKQMGCDSDETSCGNISKKSSLAELCVENTCVSSASSSVASVAERNNESINKIETGPLASEKKVAFKEDASKIAETDGIEEPEGESKKKMTSQTNSSKRPELVYRNGNINSDDDTSSTMFSSPDAGFSEEEIGDAEVTERLNARKVAMSRNRSRTEGEIFPEELPPLEYLTISPDEGVELELVGTVSGVVDVLVVVKGNSNSPALYDDTVLFLEDRDPLGLIFETFGTVERPFYSVRFNSNKDIQKKGISVGDKVLFAPKADNLTKFVFIAELKKIKCDDASWENDNEPPAAHMEFSDDEEEKRAVRRNRNKERGQNDNGEGISGRRKKRKKKPNMERMIDTGGPHLLQGELNRNPFGNKGQMFNPPMSKQWPPTDRSGQKGNIQCFQQPPPPRFAQFPPPLGHRGPNFNTFTKPQPSFANFGEKPEWKNQAGLLGQAPPNTSPGPGGFPANGNMFNSVRPFQASPRFSAPSFSPQSQYAAGLNSSAPHSMGMQPYMFGPYNPIHPMQQFPPVMGMNSQGSGPANFPVFNPSQPPPSVSSMFRPPPPPPPTSK